MDDDKKRFKRSNVKDIFEVTNQKTKVLSLTKIKNYFETISRDDFIILTCQYMEDENIEKLQLFLYYIMIFRELENVRNCLNDEEVPIEFIEKLILFIMGYCAMYDYNAIATIDFMLLFLTEECLLKLIENSNFIRGDKLLMFHILTRFDKNSLDKFFHNQEILIETMSSYYKLPEDVLTSVISRNRKFFEYIISKLLTVEDKNSKAKMYVNKFEKIINEFKTMGHIIVKYHSEVDLSWEGKLPFSKRDMSRIGYLVNTIKSMPDWEKTIEYFTQSGMFVDEHERQIIIALVSDPLLKNIFNNLDHENQIEELNNLINQDKLDYSKQQFSIYEPVSGT